MTAPEPTFSRSVLALVRRIPYGRVLSYGDVAALLGAPRAARGVGHVLSSLPESSDVPWWRVVNRSGGISVKHMGGRLQRMMLEQEGVRFGAGERIDFRQFGWHPDGMPESDED